MSEVEYPYCAFCETPLSEHPEPLCSPGVVRRLRAQLAEARLENANWREITETYNEASENWRKRAMPAEAQRDKLATLVRSLTDPNPCYFDPHGGCQEHGYLTPKPAERCPHAEAKELLASMGIELEA